MKPSPQVTVYMVGIALLALFYVPISAALGGKWLFLACAVAYVIVLRVLGNLLAKTIAARESNRDA